MNTDNIILTLLVNTAVFTVLFGLMMLVRRVFQKKLSAMVQYLLWAAVLIKLVTPFGFPSDISPFQLFKAQASPVTAQQAQAPLPLSTAQNVKMNMTDTATIPAVTDPALQSKAPDTGTDSTTVHTNTNPVSASIPWTVWALIIWGTGIIGTGAWLGGSARNLRRRITHARAAVPDSVLRVFNQCRQEMGIRRNVRIIIQRAVPAPAVMGLLNPVLILPADLKTAEEERIRHVCIHELMHLKKGDLAIICMLNILNAVYWFNPLVWVCFRIIRKDMESVCDQRVIRILGREGRQGYIGTVLQYAGRTHSLLHAAMSINDGRQKLEKRIMDMFKQNKTSRGGRIAAIIVALLMAVSGILTACQPTPSAPPVVGKTDLEQKITQSALPPNKYQAPPKVTDTASKAKVNITFDASVEVPDAEKYPVYKAEPAAFTQEQVDKIGTYLLGGRPIFTLPEDYYKQQTREELQAQIIREQQSLQRAKQMKDGEFNNVFDGESREKVYKDYEARIKDYQQKYATAPEKRANPSQPGTLKLAPYIFKGQDMGEMVNLSANTEDGQFSTFSAQNYLDEKEGYRYNSIHYEYYKDLFAQMALEYKAKEAAKNNTEVSDKVPEDLKLSREDALAQAQKALTEMGITDMQAASIDWGNIVVEPKLAGAKPSSKGFCWVVQFERVAGGVPIHPVIPSHQSDSEAPPEGWTEGEYIRHLDPESLVLSISDQGILNFEWKNIHKIATTVSENAGLIPFDQVMERAKQNIFYKTYADKDTTVDIHITSIKLGLMRVAQKDSPGAMLIIPVWDFMGTMQWTMNGKTFDPWLGEERSYLTLNAIDGSAIDREKGY